MNTPEQAKEYFLRMFGEIKQAEEAGDSDLLSSEKYSVDIWETRESFPDEYRAAAIEVGLASAFA